jgi:hypothetical protein
MGTTTDGAGSATSPLADLLWNTRQLGPGEAITADYTALEKIPQYLFLLLIIIVALAFGSLPMLWAIAACVIPVAVFLRVLFLIQTGLRLADDYFNGIARRDLTKVLDEVRNKAPVPENITRNDYTQPVLAMIAAKQTTLRLMDNEMTQKLASFTLGKLRERSTSGAYEAMNDYVRVGFMSQWYHQRQAEFEDLQHLLGQTKGIIRSA